MERRGPCRGAMAVLAAVAGSGFASGREIALFFAQTGPASWAGVGLAGLVFGLLVGLTAGAAARTDANGFPALCRRQLGRRAARLACGLHVLLLVVALFCTSLHVTLSESEEIVGEEIEIARAAAERLGRALEVRIARFPELLPMVGAG